MEEKRRCSRQMKYKREYWSQQKFRDNHFQELVETHLMDVSDFSVGCRIVCELWVVSRGYCTLAREALCNCATPFPLTLLCGRYLSKRLPMQKQPTSSLISLMTSSVYPSNDRAIACGNGHKMAAIVDPRHGNDDAARKPPVPLLRPSSICSSF